MKCMVLRFGRVSSNLPRSPAMNAYVQGMVCVVSGEIPTYDFVCSSPCSSL